VDVEWDEWAKRRPSRVILHLDSAAAGRMSWSVQRAVAEYMRRESVLGAYLAQAEASVVLGQGRADVAAMLGLDPDGVAFVESATAALAAVLSAWPLRTGDRVGVLPSEWGSNLAAFDQRGLEVVQVATDAGGVVDLDALDDVLSSGAFAVLHVCQVASHRALVQPIREMAVRTRAAGVALWVDAAQAIGHVDAAGADVVYGTGRKWLCGPRGVGLLGVARQWWPRLDVRHHVLAASDEPTVRALESDDAHVAGRVGLAQALREYYDDDPRVLWERLAEVGRMTRRALADLPGWRVVDPVDSGTAITALAPALGQDVLAERARLLAAGILTTASVPARAPRELSSATLRLSPHVDLSLADLGAVRDALSPR